MSKKLAIALNKALGLLDITLKHLISFGLDVDIWHLRNSFYTSRYKVDLVRFIKIYNPDIVIDLGCGLSDINRRVRQDAVRVSVDNCEKALKASRRFDKSLTLLKCDFVNYPSLLIDFIGPLLDGRCRPLFVLVNIAHIYEYERVTDLLNSIFGAHPDSTVVIDSYCRPPRSKPGMKNKYVHVFNEYQTLKLTSNTDITRDLYLVKARQCYS